MLVILRIDGRLELNSRSAVSKVSRGEANYDARFAGFDVATDSECLPQYLIYGVL